MQITPPFGYDEIVPLTRQHRVLLPSGSTPAFCRSINAIAVSFSEFVPAGRDYPIVFATLDGGRSFAPVAVLGLLENDNLHVDGSGGWDPGVYLPAFVRRYPFCISKLYVDGEPNGERLVCVAKAYIDAGGVALFDEAGRALPHWQPLEQLLAEYEGDLDLTARLCAALARLELLEPFGMQVLDGEREAIRLAGMYRIDEAKLNDLKPASHKLLVETGYMSRIYAHLHSLENFSRLYSRQLARESGLRRARRS